MDWRQVDVPAGLPGTELLRAVREGRLWLNLTNIQRLRPEYAALIDAMYAHLGTRCPAPGEPARHAQRRC